MTFNTLQLVGTQRLEIRFSCHVPRVRCSEPPMFVHMIRKCVPWYSSSYWPLIFQFILAFYANFVWIYLDVHPRNFMWFITHPQKVAISPWFFTHRTDSHGVHGRAGSPQRIGHRIPHEGHQWNDLRKIHQWSTSKNVVNFWLVVKPSPLKNDGLRQLGWWTSQLNGKIIQLFQSYGDSMRLNGDLMEYTYNSPKRQYRIQLSNNMIFGFCPKWLTRANTTSYNNCYAEWKGK